MPYSIDVSKTTHKRTKPDYKNLGFGKYFADHMFLSEFENNEWRNPRIQAYAPFELEPGASVLHYGQALFEGMKAFKGVDSKIRIFKSNFHAERMKAGARRLCMPEPPVELFKNSIKKLVEVDQDWIPTDKGSSLYLRPTLIGTESFLGVRPSEKYLFFVISSPVGTYYSEGFSGVKIWVETECVRAAPGGLGATKAAANYAASLYAAVQAKKKSCSQVLWLDAIHHEYVEEVGTMNVFFKIGDEVITPPLDGTILGGSTRDCVLQVLKAWGIKVQERKLSIKEIINASHKNELLEVFGTGTAAVITPVSELINNQMHLKIGSDLPNSKGNVKVGELTQRLFDEITGVQYGEKEDVWGWTELV